MLVFSVLLGLIPLTENMPSGSATKPGDVVFAMNGKSIIVDNTDAEGRLILADALCYAQEFDPQLTVDIATLTGMTNATVLCLSDVFHKQNLKTLPVSSCQPILPSAH